MDLHEFVRVFDRGISIEREYVELQELETKLERAREIRSEEIIPDAIYEYYGREIEYEERETTFRVIAECQSVFVIKFAEILFGDVVRHNCRFELGLNRMDRLDKEIESLEMYVEIAKGKIRELNFNLYMYGVRATNKAIEHYEQMYGAIRDQNEIEEELAWKKEGF